MSKTTFHIFLQKTMLRKWCNVLLLSAGWLSSCHTSKASAGYGATGNTYTISGSVTQTSSYCGGANPPKELLQQMATPVAYPGKTFYTKSGTVNDLAMPVLTSFTTDSTGHFSIHLSPGIYAIILKEQLAELNAADYETKTQVVDKDCLAEWWKKPYYLLEVKQQDISSLNFVFHHRCYIANDIPCIRYRGPLAP